MTERVLIIRMVLRWSVVVILAAAIVLGLILVVRELPPNPNAALIGLIMVAFQALGVGLGVIVAAMARNPTDKKKDGDD